MKSCNIRYIFQDKDQKSMIEINDRREKLRGLSQLSDSDSSNKLCINISDNVFDIFSGKVYKDKKYHCSDMDK